MQKSIYSDNYKYFLKWLVDARRSHEMTQRELALTLDIHHSIVGKIEIGERRLDVFEYITYCEVLGLAPEDGLQILK